MASLGEFSWCGRFNTRMRRYCLKKTHNSFVRKTTKVFATAKGTIAEIFSAMIDPNHALVRGAKVWKEKKTIMSLTAREASTLGLSSGEYESLDDLLVRIQQEDTANQPPR